MEHYDMAKVMFSSIGLRLGCTDSSEMEQLLTQLKQFFPQMRVERMFKLPSGETYWYNVKGLSSGGDDIGWWAIKQFCQRGWEPFDVTSEVIADATTSIYHFRRRTFSKTAPFLVNSG
jgi:hypothetical protein